MNYLGEKAEHIRGTAWWQGDVPDFSGMVLRARYFGNFTWGLPFSAQAFWESDASGFVNMPENEPSDGEWPYQVDGRNVIPLGTFEWMETQAPQGMAVDDTLHRLLIKQVGDEVVVEASDVGGGCLKNQGSRHRFRSKACTSQHLQG